MEGVAVAWTPHAEAVAVLFWNGVVVVQLVAHVELRGWHGWLAHLCIDATSEKRGLVLDVYRLGRLDRRLCVVDVRAG